MLLICSSMSPNWSNVSVYYEFFRKFSRIFVSVADTDIRNMWTLLGEQ